MDVNFVPKVNVPQKTEAVIFKAKELLNKKISSKEKKKYLEETENMLEELLKIDPKNKEALEFLISSYIAVAIQSVKECANADLEEKTEYLLRSIEFIEKAEKYAPSNHPTFKYAYAMLFKYRGLVDFESSRKLEEIDEKIKGALSCFEKSIEKIYFVPKDNKKNKKQNRFSISVKQKEELEVENSNEVSVPDIIFSEIGKNFKFFYFKLLFFLFFFFQ
jgi:tetratricopeptide (TPR) repeat protein